MNVLENTLLLLGQPGAPTTVTELRQLLYEAAEASGALYERDDFDDVFLLELQRRLRQRVRHS